jgi:hypothetical protein
VTEGKKVTDWEALRRDYKANLLSNRELGTKYGVSEAAIRKKAKTGEAKGEDWARDLGARIQQKAEEIVRKRVALAVDPEEKRATDRQIIEVNANAIVTIRMAHRKDIATAKGLVMELLDEVIHQTKHRDLYEALGDLLRKPDENGMDKLNDLYFKIIDRDGRVKSAKLLADSLKTLIGLEREAWNIGADDGGEGAGAGKVLTDAERASRVAAILSRARSQSDAA